MAPKKETDSESSSSDESPVVNSQLKRRKPNESETSVGPPKSKRKHKSSNSDNEGYEDTPLNISKLEFLHFVKDFKEYGGAKLNSKNRTNIQKIVSDIPQLEKYADLYNQTNFVSDLEKLYKTASLRKHASLDTVLTTINNYLTDGPSVESFPNFPQAPRRPIDDYISENKQEHASLNDYVVMRKNYASGNVNVQPYIDKYNKACKRYLNNLNAYLEENKDRLLPSHISHIDGLIKKVQKSHGSPKKANEKRKKKAKKTAFDWYKDSQKDLYSDMDAEKRERKLLKKFEKLDSPTRSIFENIASKN